MPNTDAGCGFRSNAVPTNFTDTTRYLKQAWQFPGSKRFRQTERNGFVGA